MSSSLLLSRRDLDFLLYEWLEVEQLSSRPRYADHSRETFDAMIDVSERIATDKFATHNRKNDAQEPTFDGERVQLIPEVHEALDALAEVGLVGSTVDADLGGMQLPHVVASACLAWFQAANIATTAYPILTASAASLLFAHGSPVQIATYAAPMLDGRYFGTMCLSEPQVGSSLADVTTRAEPQPDGSYRLFGKKMWISAGDHELAANIIHLVLARIPGAPAGVKGLSLFIVPKFMVDPDGGLGERNDVVLAGLIHKMGFRGTTNTMLNLGDGVHEPNGQPGAVGYRVGESHQGLTYMFHMMNEARIAVGLGATALGYTGYLKALAYARARLQGRPIAAKDPTAPSVPIIEHADVKRMLLAQKAYVEGALALSLYCSRLVDDMHTAPTAEQRDRAHLLLDVLTPISKSWPSRWCLAANDLAIQVHGGYGYAREYDVEQHYRDNRLNQIHEGTHGIQGLDLLGRKVLQQDGAGLRLLADMITTTANRAAGLGGEAAEFGADLTSARDQVVAVTRRLWATGDAETALANATLYLDVAGHMVLAWVWLEQIIVANDHDDDFYAGKRHAGRYFFRYELPTIRPLIALLENADRTTLEMHTSWF